MAAYLETAWDNTTPITHDLLNKMEGGIAAAQSTADTALDAATGGVGSAVVVIHGSDATVARPVTADPVVWVGTVSPDNINTGSGDAWVDSDAVGLDSEAVQDLINSTVLVGTGMTKTYDDTAGTVTLTATATGGGTDNSLFAYKATQTQSLSNNDTDDPHLTVAAAANTTYVVEGFLRYEASTTGDFKVRVLGPGDSTAAVMYLGPTTGTSTTTTSQYAVEAFARVAGGAGAGIDIGLIVQGTITLVTAGNVVISWAQGTTDATVPTILHAGSWLRLTPVA